MTDIEKMAVTVREFLYITIKGIRSKYIGVVDGWLVKIKCSYITMDKIRNTRGFFSRNMYYVINVKAILHTQSGYSGILVYDGVVSMSI